MLEYEILLFYIGVGFGLAAAIYALVVADRTSGAVLLLAFLLTLQSGVLTRIWVLDDQFFDCQVNGGELRECLPWGYKMALYGGTLGSWMIPLGVVMLARAMELSRRRAARERV